MCTGTVGGQKWTLDPLELELQLALIHPIEVLGTEYGFFTGATELTTAEQSFRPRLLTVG